MSEGENTAELQKEKRTLGKYIEGKLGVSLVLFSNLYGVKIQALYANWRTERGRKDIRNAAFGEYMRVNPKGNWKRFDKM